MYGFESKERAEELCHWLTGKLLVTTVRYTVEPHMRNQDNIPLRWGGRSLGRLSSARDAVEARRVRLVHFDGGGTMVEYNVSMIALLLILMLIWRSL